jgi:membrane associated rhomboid family serine protease
VSDPTGHDALARWLAYAHPLWMIASLVLATLALRAGLALRRARRGRRPRERAALRRHARLGKAAVVLVVLGYAGGLVSMALLRGREVFGTAHAFAASVALALFAVTGVLGVRLERRMGLRRPVDLHAYLALAAILAGALSLATGFVLLP